MKIFKAKLIAEVEDLKNGYEKNACSDCKDKKYCEHITCVIRGYKEAIDEVLELDFLK
jgi:hypothetical protein